MVGKQTVLIVEDQVEQLDRIIGMFEGSSFGVIGNPSYEAAVKSLGNIPISIIITDIHLKRGGNEQNTYEGLKLLEYVRNNYPDILCLVMSSDPKITTYEKAMKLGAMHYLRKPLLSIEEINIAIDLAKQKKINEKSAAISKNILIKDALAQKCQDGLVLRDSIRNDCMTIAKSKVIPAVIYGETGTGKEEVAKLIHKRRMENEGTIPFIAVNCANISQDLAVSILFGHKKGAFTGADTTTNGLIGDANGGILFLDEIHSLSIPLQQKLLRVLNDGTYERLGESKSLYSEFQVIAASTKDLDEEEEAGRFLLDLRTRLTGIDIYLEPLRERLDDIELLVPLFLAKENAVIDSLELGVLIEKCKKYYWRGNIRLLSKVIQSYVALNTLNGLELKAANFPVFKGMFAPGEKAKDVDETIVKKILQPITKDFDIEDSVSFYEKTLLESAILRHRTIGDAADALGISRSGIDQKRRKYGL